MLFGIWIFPRERFARAMLHRFDPREARAALRQLGWWLLLVPPVAFAAGSAAALFLWSLELVTRQRFEHPWLIALLPLAGILIVWAYRRHGADSERGNNLIIDEIHEPGGGVPLRMTPLVLAGTLLTHLTGGSAGREGTAVQMGGSLADTFYRLARVPREHRATLLMAGVAAGFGAVFGTPLAGAVFAIEVLAIGRLRGDGLVPCLLAALLGNATCDAWNALSGVHHTGYVIAGQVDAPGSIFGHLQPALLLKAALVGVACGWCARLFAEATHGVSAACKRWIAAWWLRPVAGAAVVLGLAWALGTTAYLGLGTWSPHPGDVTLVSLFEAGGGTPWSWFWKLVFTAVTLGVGFKGGEVTPLFFIGAALGHALSGVCGLPVDLAAGLGFVAVFAGATNTPIACTLMGVELFGGEHAVLFAVACFASYYCSGHTGIYGSQRIGARKHGDGPLGGTLAQERRRPRA